jgi:hypothetical protein
MVFHVFCCVCLSCLSCFSCVPPLSFTLCSLCLSLFIMCFLFIMFIMFIPFGFYVLFMCCFLFLEGAFWLCFLLTFLSAQHTCAWPKCVCVCVFLGVPCKIDPWIWLVLSRHIWCKRVLSSSCPLALTIVVAVTQGVI